MKKIIVGILIGIVATIGIQHLWKLYLYHKAKTEFVLFDLAKFHFERSLSDARVLDVEISPDSKAEVNFVYDKLYDVTITYERKGKIKSITAQYGNYKNTWLSPPKSELEILDNLKFLPIGIFTVFLFLVSFAFLVVSFFVIKRCSKNTKWIGWAWISQGTVFLFIIRNFYSLYIVFTKHIPEINEARELLTNG